MSSDELEHDPFGQDNAPKESAEDALLARINREVLETAAINTAPKPASEELLFAAEEALPSLAEQIPRDRVSTIGFRTFGIDEFGIGKSGILRVIWQPMSDGSSATVHMHNGENPFGATFAVNYADTEQPTIVSGYTSGDTDQSVCEAISSTTKERLFEPSGLTKNEIEQAYEDQRNLTRRIGELVEEMSTIPGNVTYRYTNAAHSLVVELARHNDVLILLASQIRSDATPPRTRFFLLFDIFGNLTNTPISTSLFLSAQDTRVEDEQSWLGTESQHGGTLAYPWSMRLPEPELCVQIETILSSETPQVRTANE